VYGRIRPCRGVSGVIPAIAAAPRELLTYQLRTVVHRTTVAVTGDGE